jgi:hypothetical protein
MRTTNSVCAGICTGAAGVVGVAAEASGAERRSTGLPSSPEVGGDEDDEDDVESEAESGARRSTGRLLSSEEDEDELDDDEEESLEARRNVGRESSEEDDEPEDPDAGYDPESLGSGCRITGREFDDPEPDPDPEFELELELEPESSERRNVGRPSSRGVSLRELV